MPASPFVISRSTTSAAVTDPAALRRHEVGVRIARVPDADVPDLIEHADVVGRQDAVGEHEVKLGPLHGIRRIRGLRRGRHQNLAAHLFDDGGLVVRPRPLDRRIVNRAAAAASTCRRSQSSPAGPAPCHAVRRRV